VARSEEEFRAGGACRTDAIGRVWFARAKIFMEMRVSCALFPSSLRNVSALFFFHHAAARRAR
jgi:hypothetical protein